MKFRREGPGFMVGWIGYWLDAGSVFLARGIGSGGNPF